MRKTLLKNPLLSRDKSWWQNGPHRRGMHIWTKELHPKHNQHASLGFTVHVCMHVHLRTSDTTWQGMTQLLWYGWSLFCCLNDKPFLRVHNFAGTALKSGATEYYLEGIFRFREHWEWRMGCVDQGRWFIEIDYLPPGGTIYDQEDEWNWWVLSIVQVGTILIL